MAWWITADREGTPVCAAYLSTNATSSSVRLTLTFILSILPAILLISALLQPVEHHVCPSADQFERDRGSSAEPLARACGRVFQEGPCLLFGWFVAQRPEVGAVRGQRRHGSVQG